MEQGLGGADVFFVSEHRRAERNEIDKFNKQCAKQGWKQSFSKAAVTAAGGKSAGVALLWRRHIRAEALNIDLPTEFRSRLAFAKFEFKKSVAVLFVSIYGFVDDPVANLRLQAQIVRAIRVVGLPFVVGG